MKNPNILILCTGNSCRSHMAEAILRHAVEETVDVHSAGSNPTGEVHPMAIQVLQEIGMDIHDHVSKHMDLFKEKEMAVVITVCDHAAEACPHFSGQVTRYHWPFPDPAKMAGTEEEILQFFRLVRDQIRLVFDMYAAGLVDGSKLFRSKDTPS